MRGNERGPGVAPGGQRVVGPLGGRGPPFGGGETLDRREVGLRPGPDGDAGREGDVRGCNFDLVLATGHRMVLRVYAGFGSAPWSESKKATRLSGRGFGDSKKETVVRMWDFAILHERGGAIELSGIVLWPERPEAYRGQSGP